MKTTMSFVVASALAASASSLMISNLAKAHARLVYSFPSAKAHLERPVKTIKLQFNGKADAHYSTVMLEGEGGLVLAEATPQTPTPEIVLPTPPLQPGSYRVHYRVLSTDGDIVEGGVDFVIDK